MIQFKLQKKIHSFTDKLNWLYRTRTFQGVYGKNILSYQRKLGTPFPYPLKISNNAPTKYFVKEILFKPEVA